MNNTLRNLRGITKGSGLVFCLCAAVLMTSSCTPLRKKFTRKKKEDRENDKKFIPILDPIDYPEKVTLAKDKYNHHYLLWKVWDKDLIQNVETDGSDKRQVYLLNQSVSHLDEMVALLNGDKRAQLSKLIDDYRSILNEYDKPASVRNKNSLKRKIVRAGREVRNNYSPKLLANYWKHEPSTGTTDQNE